MISLAEMFGLAPTPYICRARGTEQAPGLAVDLRNPGLWGEMRGAKHQMTRLVGVGMGVPSVVDRGVGPTPT